eukprot:15016202-Alexandrium_andersonii.AAC.1
MTSAPSAARPQSAAARARAAAGHAPHERSWRLARAGSGSRRDPAMERSSPCVACHRPPLLRELTAALR